MFYSSEAERLYILFHETKVFHRGFWSLCFFSMLLFLIFKVNLSNMFERLLGMVTKIKCEIMNLEKMMQ